MIQTTGQEDVIAEEIQKGQEALNTLKGLSFDDAIHKLANSIVDFGFKLLIAILVFYIGRFIIRKIFNTTLSIMTKRKMDYSLITFVLSLVKIVLYFILIITIIGILGLETSSFLALFASAGVAIGMALSGTLQNFAGGVLILLLKPYKVGDFIEAQGFSGTVQKIELFSTTINTTDFKTIIIPNGGLSTGSINNYSKEEYRRVDWKIGLSYDTDFESAKNYILGMLESDKRVVQTDYLHQHAEILKQQQRNEDCLNNPEDCEETEGQEIEKEKSWWYRMTHRSKLKKKNIQSILEAQKASLDPRLLQTASKPFVGLSDLADSSITVVVRAWTLQKDYWGLFFEMNERFYKELPEHNFNFPFPQLDVHLSHQN